MVGQVPIINLNNPTKAQALAGVEIQDIRYHMQRLMLFLPTRKLCGVSAGRSEAQLPGWLRVSERVFLS